MIGDRGIGPFPREVAVSDAGEVFDFRNGHTGSVDDVVDLVALAGVGEIAPIALGIRDLIARGKWEANPCGALLLSLHEGIEVDVSREEDGAVPC